jgi:hypothetical protein
VCVCVCVCVCMCVCVCVCGLCHCDDRVLAHTNKHYMTTADLSHCRLYIVIMDVVPLACMME